MKYAFLTIAGILLMSCQASKIIEPTQADVDRVATKYQGYSLDQLKQGKILAEQHCTQCHKLKNPSDRTEEKLNNIVPKMFLRVAKKEGKPMDKSEEQLVLQYMLTMSKKGS